MTGVPDRAAALLLFEREGTGQTPPMRDKHICRQVCEEFEAAPPPSWCALLCPTGRRTRR